MTAAFSREPVCGGEVARLDALDVVRGQRREDARRRRCEIEEVSASLARKMFRTIATSRPMSPMNR